MDILFIEFIVLAFILGCKKVGEFFYPEVSYEVSMNISHLISSYQIRITKIYYTARSINIWIFNFSM